MDPRELPNYGMTEAARYLAIPVATLRYWTLGSTYQTATGNQTSNPLIELPDSDDSSLSFMNLVEASALATIRRRHRIQMTGVRDAIRYLSENLNSRHPLAERLETDGLDLFISKYGQLINLSKRGQLGIRECLEAHLQRIEHDQHGLAMRLFPWTRPEDFKSPRIIVIDPRISFGKPLVFGTGIRTEVLGERYLAGDSIAELSKDYGIAGVQVEEAIRYQFLAA